MFSIQQCKRYLKNPQYSEQQIERSRDSLYQLADILVDNYLKKQDVMGKKQDDADKRSSIVNEARSERSNKGLVSRAIDIFVAEITG